MAALADRIAPASRGDLEPRDIYERRMAAEQVIDEVQSATEVVRSFIKQAQDAPADVENDAFFAAKEAMDRASIPVHENAIVKSLAAEQTRETYYWGQSLP